MNTFAELGVAESFIKALSENSIFEPTEIQLKVIPILLSKETDLIAQAQTGTGKTAAFGLPLLQKVNPANSKIQALILTPTRELGQQIAKQLFRYTKHGPKIFTEAVYGGASIDEQIKALKRPTQIVVATPGRLIDLMERKAIDLAHVKTVVMDEADEMLSMGFKKELDKILADIKGIKNTWLFSATMPEEIKLIIQKYMASDAIRIEVNKKQLVNKDIEHYYITCEEKEKPGRLMYFLDQQGNNRGIIFCNTKAGAQNLARQLVARNYEAEAIHGDLQQKERDKVMRAFRNKKLQILIATDVAARGIDIENISYVIHYQLPDQLEYYTHRSGRTARAGKKGFSLALVHTKEMDKLQNIQKTMSIKFKKYS